MGVGPRVTTVTSTTHGTRTQLGGGTSTYVVAIYVEALATNSGNIYLGDSTVSATKYMAKLAAGIGFGITMNTYGKTSSTAGGPEIQLDSFWLDSSADGDKLQVTYFERVGHF